MPVQDGNGDTGFHEAVLVLESNQGAAFYEEERVALDCFHWKQMGKKTNWGENSRRGTHRLTSDVQTVLLIKEFGRRKREGSRWK